MGTKIITFLRKFEPFLIIAGFPTASFLIDLLLRFFLRLRLEDAGPDMALLSMSIFLSATFDPDDSNYLKDRVIKNLLTGFLIILWLVCLFLISPLQKELWNLSSFEFIAIGIGVMSLVLSSNLIIGLRT